MTALVIVGAGGHGRELGDVVRALVSAGADLELVGFVDDDPQHPERVARTGSRLLGGLPWLEDHTFHYALGIGTSATRRAISTRLDRAGMEPVTLVHPGASVGSDVDLGNGGVVYDRCVITTNVTLGAHTHLNVGCVVQHDSVVGDFVQFSPGVFVNGDCVIGDDVFLGTGAIVTRGCTVGPGARVGAGAVVLHDVAAGSTVVGAPAHRSSGP